MRLLLSFFIALLWANHALGRAVFAHFMVGNTEHYSAADWIDDITLAQEAHIDAFALNMAQGEPMNEKAIADVFSHAEAKGFKLFFSFDYAGRGPYSKSEVLGWINKYASSSAYFRHQGRPLVSTFEGPDQAEDWIEIKAVTGCFFIPDWSSLGAKPAMEAAGGVADGLFSWAGWPWGDKDMDTYIDASYRQYLAGKPYMMPVSPWFYTNLPGYNKNWMWRGDHLWFDRWIHVNTLMPEFVQIISWNDYGESHHIGPIRDHALVAFDTGKAPYKYSLDHHGWRVFLPFTIDRYKNNKATVTFEGVSFWYRTTPKNACNTGGTTGNTVQQLQKEFQPYDIVEDRVFFSVLLTSSATVKVKIGGVESEGVWRDLPDGGVGLYHGSVPFDGRTGPVNIRVWRKDVLIANLDGPEITTNCHNGMTGYDAWAGGKLTSKAQRPMNTPSLEDEVCIRGGGAPDFEAVCRATCSLGYCPSTACVCKATGAPVKLPPEVPGSYYPAEGLSSNYIGLCNFACLYGACLENYCGKTQHPLIEPTVSPFNPPACTSGTGDGDWEALCSFTCRLGYCPIARCKCTGEGPLILVNPTKEAKAISRIGQDHGMCGFACARGFCPKSVCDSTGGQQQGQTEPPIMVWDPPHLDKECYRFPECVDLDNPQASSCKNGYIRVGWDRSDCSRSTAKPICCNESTKPINCTWRGGGLDCNGQCHKGEVNLFESKRGGEEGESGDSQCNRGHKVFCCRLKTFAALTSQCRWSACSELCAKDEVEVARARDLAGKCSFGSIVNRYCCKSSQPPLGNCHWVGQGDCADNHCDNKEVTLEVDENGGNGVICDWWRKKSLCCAPNHEIFEEGVCPKTFCDAVGPLSSSYCLGDVHADDFSDEDYCEDPSSDEDFLRDIRDEEGLSRIGPLSLEERAILEKRGEKRKYNVTFDEDLPNNQKKRIILSIRTRGYPGATNLHNPTRSTPASDNVFSIGQGCDNVDVVVSSRKIMNRQYILLTQHTEHNPDVKQQYSRDLMQTWGTGILPNGRSTKNGKILPSVLDRYWNSKYPSGTFPVQGSSRCINTPNDFFMDGFGSQGNRKALVLCEGALNMMKGRVFNIMAEPDPVDISTIDDLRAQMLLGDSAAERQLFSHLRLVIMVWNYVNHPLLLPTVTDNRGTLLSATQLLSNTVPPLGKMNQIHREFDKAWYQEAADRSRTWLTNRLDEIIDELDLEESLGQAPPNAARIRSRVQKLRSRMSDIKPPPPPP